MAKKITRVRRTFTPQFKRTLPVRRSQLWRNTLLHVRTSFLPLTVYKREAQEVVRSLQS